MSEQGSTACGGEKLEEDAQPSLSPQNETVSEASNLRNLSRLNLASPGTEDQLVSPTTGTPPGGRTEDTDQQSSSRDQLPINNDTSEETYLQSNSRDQPPINNDTSDNTDQQSSSRDQPPINNDTYEDAEPASQDDQAEPRETQTPLVATTAAESPGKKHERGEKKHDIALVFDEQDEEVADNILEEMAEISVDGVEIDVRHFDDVIFGANIVDRPKKICNSCLLVFVVQTEKPPQDRVITFLKDEMVAKLRVIEGKDNIQSLMTCDGLETLSGLTSLAGFRWYQTDKRRKKLEERIRHLRSAYNRGPLKPLDKCDGATAGGSVKVRGLCIIVNNYECVNSQDIPKKVYQLSTKGQEDKVNRFFRSRNFNAISYCNQTYEDMTDLLDDASKEDHSEFDCFVFYVIADGDCDYIRCSDGKYLQLSEQWKKFLPRNCESLRNKAKVFFFCSSRTIVDPNDQLRDEYTDQDPEEMKDFFFCYPCQRNCEANRTREKDTGDIYTEEFLKVMEAKKGMKFLEQMAIVSEAVKGRTQYDGREEHIAIPDTITESAIDLVL